MVTKANEILPNPDPSVITTQQIDKAVSNLEDKISTRLDGIEKATESFHADLTRVPTLLDRSVQSLRELLEERLAGMDKDIKMIHETLDKRQAVIREQVLHLEELMIAKLKRLAAVTEEKFVGVGAQFSERDTRTDQRAGDTKLAVDAAFAAAKEATAKIEAGFTKQIDSMTMVIDTKTENLNGRLSDLKDQITSYSSRATGKSEGSNWLWGVFLGAGGFLIALVTLGVVFSRHAP